MGTKTDRLEDIRAELGLNKAEFAALMGISAHYYYHILGGKGAGNLRLEHLESLLLSKGVNPAWIMTGEGEKFLHREGVKRPRITPEMLKAVISDNFPKGWDSTWMGKVVDSACKSVIAANPDLSLVEMENAALIAALSIHAQLQALIDASGAKPGDRITLNLEGETFAFLQMGDDE